MPIVTGWKRATRHVGHGVSAMRLRRAVQRGELRATRLANGYSFDTDDLDAFRATLVLTAASIANAITPPSPASVALATAVTASSSTSPPIALATAPSAPSALAWAEAVAARGAAAAGADDDADDRDDEAEDAPVHQPPFWEQATPSPSWPTGEPVIDPISWVISYRPVSAAAATTHTPGTQGAHVQQIQQQLAQTQALLAQAQAEREGYRVAWRVAQASSIAHAVSNEALLAGTLPAAAQAAWSAAGSAADQLSDDQLADATGYSLAVGRAAGMAAAQQMGAAIVWQHAQAEAARHDRGGDDLSRARRRRSSRWW